MPRRLTLAACLPALLGLWTGAAAAAAAAGPLAPCGRALTCGYVTAPLDPSGAAPGRVRLYVKRYAPSGDANGTVLAIAGGPGESPVAALPLFVKSLGPVLRGRALVVIDPRGVDRSSPLDCRISGQSACVHELAAKGRFFATVDSVNDIDTVRAALGVPQMIVYGVSYGTYTGLAYARAFPSHVERLVLDSVVPADGVQALDGNVFAAMHDLFGGCVVACPGPSPLEDLGTVLGTIRRAAQRQDTAGGAYALIRSTDLSPLARAELPTMLHLAAHGEPSALGHLSAGLLSTSGAAERLPAFYGDAQDFNFLDTLVTGCDDTAMPWQPAASLAARRAAAHAALGAVDPASYAPFPASVIYDGTYFPLCVYWPPAGSAPPRETAPLPSVPTLLLSGEDDLRTPPADAAALASQLPAATLLSVPNTGHAVLLNDRSGCALRAMEAFAAAGAVSPCAPAPRLVDPLPPASYAALTPAGGSGVPGEVLHAVALTLEHEVLIGSPGDMGGGPGTAGGFYESYGSAAMLGRLAYIRGVSLTGGLRRSGESMLGTLRVDVNGRPYGRLTLGRGYAMAGALGGEHVALGAAQFAQLADAAGLSPLRGLA